MTVTLAVGKSKALNLLLASCDRHSFRVLSIVNVSILYVDTARAMTLAVAESGACL